MTAIAQDCCEQYWTSPGSNTPQNSSCLATYHPSWKLSNLDKPDMHDTAGGVSMNSEAIYSCGPLHIDKQRQPTSYNLYTTALCW